MVIVYESCWPPDSSEEVGKAFLALPPLQEFITMKGPFVSSTAGIGIRSIAVYECDESKTAEAFKTIHDRYVNYLKIPGYTYSLKLWLGAEECLKMIGLV